MLLRGVKFGDYHTATEWELILNKKSITPPKPKTVYVSVNGRDGDLDLSEALTGEIKYENRTASFSFLLTNGSNLDRENIITEILAVIHGRKLQIIDDDYPDHYLVGRCTVTGSSNNKSYGSIDIQCNCDPWRYSINDVIRSKTVSGTPLELLCVNSGVKTVIPELKVTGDITLQFGTTNVSLSDGSYKLANLLLKTGTTKLIVGGSGSLTVTYKEAIL